MYFRPLIGVTWGYCITPISNNRLRRPILLSSSPVYPPQIRTSLHLRWFQGFFLCNAVVLPRFLAVSWWCLVVVNTGSSEIHSMKIGLKILSWFKVAGWICVNRFLFFLFVEAKNGLNIKIDMLFTCSFGPQNKNNDCVAQTNWLRCSGRQTTWVASFYVGLTRVIDIAQPTRTHSRPQEVFNKIPNKKHPWLGTSKPNKCFGNLLKPNRMFS